MDGANGIMSRALPCFGGHLKISIPAINVVKLPTELATSSYEHN